MTDKPKDWPKYFVKEAVPPPPDEKGWVLCSWLEDGTRCWSWMHEAWLQRVVN